MIVSMTVLNFVKICLFYTNLSVGGPLILVHGTCCSILTAFLTAFSS